MGALQKAFTQKQKTLSHGTWVIADTTLEEFLSDPFAVEATQLRSALTHSHTHGALLTSLILSHKALH